MKRALNSFTITTILLLTITSCSTDCDEPTKVPLKELDKYVPYTGYDTLRFLHNNTDTQTFIGQGINYFWVREGKSEPSCPEDHQSLVIQFRNRQNGNIIKMEYVYDNSLLLSQFDYSVNSHTYYKFYYDRFEWIYGEKIYVPNKPFNINNYDYPTLTFFTVNGDTSENYLAFRNVFGGDFGGIVKLKVLNDTLTLIR